ncbi:hypothetical protein [Paraburkholderia polaris]|uniref:hypothetical protein n=1 Tax=Paraburkholderia polaris TaxID=2728848 RepID=UPI001E519E15|nr:hypothetical protein [Paraburkholderia polaris]
MNRNSAAAQRERLLAAANQAGGCLMAEKNLLTPVNRQRYSVLVAETTATRFGDLRMLADNRLSAVFLRPYAFARPYDQRAGLGGETFGSAGANVPVRQPRPVPAHPFGDGKRAFNPNVGGRIMLRRTPARSEQTQTPDIQPGDRVRSIWLRRTGTAVKVYPDGSAAVRWDDGDKTLKHQTMPQHVLELIEQLARSRSNHAPLPNSLTERFPLFAYAGRNAAELWLVGAPMSMADSRDLRFRNLVAGDTVFAGDAARREAFNDAFARQIAVSIAQKSRAEVRHG